MGTSKAASSSDVINQRQQRQPILHGRTICHPGSHCRAVKRARLHWVIVPLLCVLDASVVGSHSTARGRVVTGHPLLRLRGGRLHPLMYPWLSNKEVPDYYAALNLEQTASAEEVRAAYKRLVLELHPDRTEHRTSNDPFIAVRDAWEVCLLTPTCACHA
jgi:hypothetical protein